MNLIFTLIWLFMSMFMLMSMCAKNVKIVVFLWENYIFGTHGHEHEHGHKQIKQTQRERERETEREGERKE